MHKHSSCSLRIEQHDADGMVPLSIALSQAEGILEPHSISTGTAIAPAAATITTNATHNATAAILAMILVVYILTYL
jgi:hypothetical protein